MKRSTNFFLSCGPVGQKRTVEEEIDSFKRGDAAGVLVNFSKARGKAMFDTMGGAGAIVPGAVIMGFSGVYNIPVSLIALPFKPKKSVSCMKDFGRASGGFFINFPRVATSATAIVSPELMTKVCRTDYIQKIGLAVSSIEKMEDLTGSTFDYEKCKWR